MSRSILKGVSWDHSRAYPPLVAAAQRFGEVQSEVTVTWEKRSLHEFGHASLAELCGRYDLIVVDHPMMGEAHEHGLLHDLKLLLEPELLSEMSGDSVGESYTSYLFEGHLYALPIDAAAPAASCRPDLLTMHGLSEPASWQEMLSIARRGLVRMPGFPADLFLNFMGLCVSQGATIASSNEELVERPIALQCLEQLRELASYMPDDIYRWNPIVLYERMVAADEFVYCPFAYTYSNYSRPGFAGQRLRFSSPVPLPDGQSMRTVLGGTGIAIARATNLLEPALAFAKYVQSSTCQRTVYALAGGQPARRNAWLDPTLNQIADDFFLRTLPSMERACVRPRYAGYVPFQEKSGVPLGDYFQGHRSSKGLSEKSGQRTLDQIDALYRESLKEERRA